MEENKNVGESSALLQVQAELWNHTFSFLKSMCLKCAVELSIPDAISCHGESISFTELLRELSIQPSKADYLRRLMRALVNSGFFSVDQINREEVYGLTPLSRLLVTGGNGSLSPFVKAMLHPILVQPSLSMSSWFKCEVLIPSVYDFWYHCSKELHNLLPTWCNELSIFYTSVKLNKFSPL